jgi:hypothetical protein
LDHYVDNERMMMPRSQSAPSPLVLHVALHLRPYEQRSIPPTFLKIVDPCCDGCGDHQLMILLVSVVLVES